MARKTFQNRELLQSWVLTSSKYVFTKYEKLIYYKIIELLQAEREGRVLNKKHTIQPLTDGYTKFTLPVGDFLPDGDNNYKEVIKALDRLNEKKVYYEDDKMWEKLSLAEKPRLFKEQRSSYVTFELSEKVFNAFLDFSKGYRAYELKIALSFTSEYAMRFYELFSGQVGKDRFKTYSFDWLRERFGLMDKYNGKNGKSDFTRKVIKKAQEELNAKSPFTFKYHTKYGDDNFYFEVIFQEQFADKEIESVHLYKQQSPQWDFTSEELDLIRDKWKFDKNGLNGNRHLFRSAKQQGVDLLHFLQSLDPSAAKSSPQGMFVNFIRKELAKKMGAAISEQSAEPAKMSHEEIAQSMTDEQYQEYKQRQRNNYSDVVQGSGEKMRSIFEKIGKKFE